MTPTHVRRTTFREAFAALALLCVSLAATALAGAEATRKSFDIPAGTALETLKQFTAQSGGQLLYSAEAVEGVRTSAAKGQFTPVEALHRMFAGTELTVVEDRNGGGLTVRREKVDEKNAGRAAQPIASDRPGQTPNKASRGEEEAIALSPFLVQAEPGWNATETLSGTRLRTDLRNVPNSIETFTKDFMDDLGLNNIDDALIYSVNAENNSEFLPSNAETPAFYANDGGRIRGIGAGTKSMNMFQTNISSDNYNLDSTSLVSGPNSTLFGLGSPSGTIDANPSQALMRNKANTRLQYSSENSKRATLDINRVIIPQKLAIRLMALWKNDETHNKPNYDKDQRVTGAVTLQPFKTTVLRARVERVNRDFNRAPRTAPYDSLSNWLFADQVPGSPFRTGKPAYDNRTAIPANLTATTRIFTAGPGRAVLIANNPTAPAMGWGQSVAVLNPSAATAFGVPDSQFDAGVNRTFRDESVFPLDVNPFGNLKTTKLGGTTTTLFLEQRLVDTLFLELASNLENSYQGIYGARGQSMSAIYADANLYLPALLPGQTAYAANPNFGKYYVEYAPNPNPSVFREQNLRATLSYELDLHRKFANHWGRWLGTHRFATMVSRKESMNSAQLNLVPRILDDPVLPGRPLNAKNVANWAIDGSRQLQVRSYLDNSFRPVSLPTSPDEPFQFVDATGKTYYTTGGADSGLVDRNGKRLSTSNNVLTAGKTRTDTQLFVWQGQFLPDRKGSSRLILTYGYREDAVRSALPDVASRTQDSGVGRTGFYPLYTDVTWDSFSPSQTGLTRNTGVVVRPLSWVSFSFNDSSTFEVNSGQFNPFGAGYPGAHGEGREYGVRLDFWDNRFSLRLNKYDNVLGPSRVANNINNYRSNFLAIENRVLQLDPSLSAPNNWFAAKLNYGYDNYFIASDRTSEGYELSIDFRPVPNWNIRLNGAKSKAVESNIGHDWADWIAQRLPVWQSVVAKNGEVDASGRPVTWQTADVDIGSVAENRTLKQYYDEQVVGTALAFMQAADGRNTDGARGKRANLITNYRFSEGSLRGVSVGGAIRWRPAPTIGYPIKTNSVGTKILDVAHPFLGKQEFPLDLSLGYRGRLRYFGGISYSVQLNVRNALDQDRPIPLTAFSNGVIARYATVEPRLFILSTSFDF